MAVDYEDFILLKRPTKNVVVAICTTRMSVRDRNPLFTYIHHLKTSANYARRRVVSLCHHKLDN